MRLTTQQVGMIVGLVSLTFFFGALLLAFGLRMDAQTAWPRFHVPALLWASTGAIAASSALLEAARYSLRRALIASYRTRILGAILLGVCFLIMQSISAADLIGQGVPIAGNPRGSAFYVFMGVHGVHLFAAIVWLIVLWHWSHGLFNGSEQDLRRHRRYLSSASLFWHFMGLLWILLFLFLRLWSHSAV